MNNCIGCTNIKKCNFPFRNHSMNLKDGRFIDSEGCGLIQNKDDYYLEIFYCPVCGKKLCK